MPGFYSGATRTATRTATCTAACVLNDAIAAKIARVSIDCAFVPHIYATISDASNNHGSVNRHLTE